MTEKVYSRVRDGIRFNREALAERLNRRSGLGPRSDRAIADLLSPSKPGETSVEKAALRPLRRAAVLIPLVERPSGQTVLLTKRTDHLHHHPGQVSFPGGGLEEEDKDSIACALRETEEETGLSPDHIEVVGCLEDYVTGTNFQITPVVALVTPPFALRPDPFEVAAVFEVPLSFVLDPANHRREERIIEGRKRAYYAIPYDGYHIWGATAGMLVGLSRALLAGGER